MTGMQLPARVGATAVRMPDAVYAPGSRLAARPGAASERRPASGVDPYGRYRTMPAGLLVDLYG